MKVLFKNITKYDKEKYNDFESFHEKKYGKKEIIKFIIICLCALYLLISNIIFKNFRVVLVILIVSIIIYMIYKYKTMSQAKNKRKVKEFTFYFYDNHIKVKRRKESERIRYFNLHKIFETDEYFFLYLDEKNSLILSKDGFTVGTPDKFSKFIKNKCPFKYKIEKDK